ncbi:MAG: DUF4931 domain-containing protein [Candidatus Micrarchaeota archaeon]
MGEKPNEFRKDFLLNRWVIVAANRGKRPEDYVHKKRTLKKEGLCFFCPGNEHTTPPEINRREVDGKWVIRVFPNKFYAVSLDFPNAYGTHEVIVESSNHGHHLSDIPEEQMRMLLEVYRERIDASRKIDGLKYSLIFKNQGHTAGASLGHTHTQMVSMNHVPTLVRMERDANKEYTQKTGKCGFCERVEEDRERVVWEDDNVFCYAPYASRFSFEHWIMPKRHVGCLTKLDDGELDSLAKCMKTVLGKLDKMLDYPPYNYALHIDPFNATTEYYHFHIEVLPRLNIWAGFELGAGTYINPMLPEKAAKALRE